MDQWKVFIADFHSTYDVLWVLYGRINVATNCKIPHGCKINKKFKKVRIKTVGALSGSLPLNHVWILTIHILPPERLRNKQTHNYPATVIHFFWFSCAHTRLRWSVHLTRHSCSVACVWVMLLFLFKKALFDSKHQTIVTMSSPLLFIPLVPLPAHTDCSHVWVPHSHIETRLVLSSVRRFIVFVVAIAGCPPCHIRHWVRCLLNKVTEERQTKCYSVAIQFKPGQTINKKCSTCYNSPRFLARLVSKVCLACPVFCDRGSKYHPL